MLEQEPVSKLCDELGCKPKAFYRWQKELFDNGAAVFQAKTRSHHQAEQKRIEYLEKKIQRKDEVLAELMEEHVASKKRSWGALTGVWVAHDIRDQTVDFVRRWSEASEIGVGRFIRWLGVASSKFYSWRERAALLARLAVDKSQQGKGLGRRFCSTPVDPFQLLVLLKDLRRAIRAGSRGAPVGITPLAQLTKKAVSAFFSSAVRHRRRFSESNPSASLAIRLCRRQPGASSGARQESAL